MSLADFNLNILWLLSFIVCLALHEDSTGIRIGASSFCSRVCFEELGLSEAELEYDVGSAIATLQRAVAFRRFSSHHRRIPSHLVASPVAFRRIAVAFGRISSHYHRIPLHLRCISVAFPSQHCRIPSHFRHTTFTLCRTSPRLSLNC